MNAGSMWPITQPGWSRRRGPPATWLVGQVRDLLSRVSPDTPLRTYPTVRAAVAALTWSAYPPGSVRA